MFSVSSKYISLWSCNDVGTWFHANSSNYCWFPMSLFLCSNLVTNFQWRELFCLSIIVKFLFVLLILYFSFDCLWFNLFRDEKLLSSR